MMKSCLKWVVIIGCILLVVVLVFLQFFLGKTIKAAVEQNTDKFLTAKVEMEDLSFNILGGSVDLKGLKVHNPEGFTGDYLYKLDRSKEDLSILALFKNQIVIEEITIKNSDLFVSRNKDGRINLNELVKKTEKKEKAPKEEKPEEEKVTEKKGEVVIPPLWLKEMNITSAIDYVDEKIAEDPFKIGFLINIASKDIATFGPEDRRGTFSIKGHLRDSEDEFVLDINVEAPPVKDVDNPTFTAVSKITSVDAKKLAAYKDVIKIEEGILNITSHVTCVNGEIIKDQSLQTIEVNGLKVTEDFKESNAVLKNVDIPERLVFSFALFGRIDSPQHDAEKALLDALVKNLGDVVKDKAKDELKKKMGDKLDKTPLGGLLGGKDKKEEAESQPETSSDEEKKEEDKSPLGSIKKLF
ncbi:MAG: AsmA family protein [Candidatus Aureabacteria bacterium]|nr:AsmA family protein [Candidatus Auribacterota bacterium]